RKGKNAWAIAILLQRVFARAQKKFLIAFCAGEMTGAHSENFKTGLASGLADVIDRFLVEVGIADNAALGDLGVREFELRLDQDQGVGPGFEQTGKWFHDLRNGNEGNVGDGEIDLFGDLPHGEFARVTLDANDAGVLLKLPGELRDVDVDGV